jgi:hypothetical protein
MLDLEIENRNKSSYEEFFGRSALEQVRSKVKEWLVAGKSS